MPGDVDARVVDALSSVAGDVVQTDRAAWKVSLTNGSVVPAHGRVLDGWFELSVDVASRAFALADPEKWLRLNASLDGSARAAFAPGAGTMQLRADVGIDDDADLEARIASACDDVRAALHLVAAAPERHAHGDNAVAIDAFVEEIAHASIEAGWPAPSRRDGRLGLDLDTRAGLVPARLDPMSSRSGRWVVELSDISAASTGSRRATALLLFMLSSVVRSVKAIVFDRGDTVIGAVASAVDHPLSARTVERSLSALTVACGLAAREARALCDERLAAAYLAAWDLAAWNDELPATNYQPPTVNY